MEEGGKRTDDEMTRLSGVTDVRSGQRLEASGREVTKTSGKMRKRVVVCDDSTH